MQIILSRKEYLDLRPNQLKDTLIEAVRAQLNSEDIIEAKYDMIGDALKTYDREIERSKKDEIALWPDGE